MTKLSKWVGAMVLALVGCAAHHPSSETASATTACQRTPPQTRIACSGSDPWTHVKITNSRFDDSSATKPICAGDTVTWVAATGSPAVFTHGGFIVDSQLAEGNSLEDEGANLQSGFTCIAIVNAPEEDGPNGP
jgi:hypothetical protein